MAKGPENPRRSKNGLPWGAVLSVVLLAVLAAVSCLPADDRPVPATVYVSVTADETILGGMKAAQSVDGWSLTYERFLLSIGNSSFGESSNCSRYYDADYFRVLDLHVAGPQKLGISYALGHCDFGFRVSGPTAIAVLGQDVTNADLALLGTPGSDPYVTNRGVSLYVKGSATNGGARKTFEWSFRQRVRYDKCGDPDGGKEGFDLVSGARVSIDLRVHGETLFLDQMDATSGQIRFGPFSLADDRYGNADGSITLDELGQVPLGDIQTAGGLYATSNSAIVTGGDGGTLKSLEDFVYLGVFPRVVRYRDTESCELRTGNRAFGR